jgi:hypothetical protein
VTLGVQSLFGVTLVDPVAKLAARSKAAPPWIHPRDQHGADLHHRHPSRAQPVRFWSALRRETMRMDTLRREVFLQVRGHSGLRGARFEHTLDPRVRGSSP